MNKLNRRHRRLVALVILALKSRRVMVALAALLVGGLVSAVPVLAPVENELLTLVVALSLALIGGYTVEDAARAGRNTKTDTRELVKAAVDEVFDRMRAQENDAKDSPEPE